ncbi:MAG: anion transporter, partial [Deltaproteobacteria bacterium]|nr:anion transporter [Deltaproteobacteria bacterium]
MFLKTKGFKLCLALALGIVVLLLPRPEGTKFRITGDESQTFFQHLSQHFTIVSTAKGYSKGYMVEAKKPGSPEA